MMKGNPSGRRRGARRGQASVVLNVVLLIGLLVLLGLLLWRYIPRPRGPVHDPAAKPRAVEPAGHLLNEEQARIELYKEIAPSVVHVTSFRGRRSLDLNLERIPLGTGSGFIWDRKGYVVTNYHVIQNAAGEQVTLSDGSAWDATVVGTAPDKDLAVLKIDAPADKLTPIPVGSSADLQVGQTVLAIGNPFGLDQTLTTGVISGLGREISSVTDRPIEGVIQTDAAINPGNSGGPLLDSHGRLIGINTAILSPSHAYAGIGFAVPVDTINQIVPDLIRDGQVVRPGMGIALFEDSIVKALRQRRWIDELGALVKDVVADSPAAQAGIRPTRETRDGDIVLGDLIVAADGDRVEGNNDLFRILGRHKVGDTITVTVLRDGEKVDLKVSLVALSSLKG